MTIVTPVLEASTRPGHGEQDQRMATILRSVRDAFVEKGFDGASMQDLARAAGMSVGNFYRYFPSKDAIIVAIVRMDLVEVEAEFAAVNQSSDPLGTLREILVQHIHGTCSGDCALFAEITAAARRKPEIALAVGRMESEIHAYLLAVFALATGLSADEVARHFSGHAAFLMMLVTATGMREPSVAARKSGLDAMILRTIDRTLADIVPIAVKV